MVCVGSVITITCIRAHVQSAKFKQKFLPRKFLSGRLRKTIFDVDLQAGVQGFLCVEGTNNNIAQFFQSPTKSQIKRIVFYNMLCCPMCETTDKLWLTFQKYGLYLFGTYNSCIKTC